MDISYCRHCGASLKLFRGNLIGYTANKGKKIYDAYLVCPNKKRKWIFDDHDRWEGHIYEDESEFHFDSGVIDF